MKFNPHDSLYENIDKFVKRAKRKIRRKAKRSYDRLDKAHGEAVVREAKRKFRARGAR